MSRPPTVRVFSDLTCPWAYLTAWRLQALRPEIGARARLVWASLPLEVVNRQPTPKDVLDAELPLLRQLAPGIEARDWSAPLWQWPSTVLPAFEAVKCAEAQSDEAAWRLDWRIRRAFFVDSLCISARHVLLGLAEEVGLDAARLADDFDAGRFRGRVMAESREGWETLAVDGSPTLVLPDGRQDSATGLPKLEMDGSRVTLFEPPAGSEEEIRRALLATVLGAD